MRLPVRGCGDGELRIIRRAESGALRLAPGGGLAVNPARRTYRRKGEPALVNAHCPACDDLRPLQRLPFCLAAMCVRDSCPCVWRRT